MLRAAAFVLCLIIGLVSANFDFFGNMFGSQDHEYQQQQQQQRSGASQWAVQVENTPCPHYLCPATLDCVLRPADCPCPNVEDIKCTIPDTTSDATVVCARGQFGCAEVRRLMEKGVPKASKTK